MKLPTHNLQQIAFRHVFVVAAGVFCVAWLAGICLAKEEKYIPYDMRKPKNLDGVTVVEHLDETVPGDLPFKDWNDNPVKLGDLFDGDLPVILTLNYSDCPMLCNVQLNALVATMSQMDLQLGSDYKIVTVSVDPTETVDKAAASRKRYLEAYGKSWKEPGWLFLRGENENIQTLADAVGFGYRFVPSRGEYAHAAVIMICTPDGKLSRYLYGVTFQPSTLKLSLVEASEGKIGDSLDQILLFCFHYDATEGRYGPTAFRMMQIGGAVFVLVLGILLVPFWIRGRLRRQPARSQQPEGSKQPSGYSI